MESVSFKVFVPLLFGLAGAASGSAQAAAVIGTYQFSDAQLVDNVVGASNNWFYTGSVYKGYNGSGWVDGSNNSTTPSELTDATTSTLFATTASAANTYVDLSFDVSAGVINGSGNDLALFFIWDQSGNQASVSINGHTEALSFQSVFDGQGDLQVANNILWNGVSYDNQMLSVALLDLSLFGFSDNAPLTSSFRVSMGRTSDVDVALSLVGALNTEAVSAVPIPAAVWLFGSGLLGLVGVARRRSAV